MEDSLNRKHTRRGKLHPNHIFFFKRRDKFYEDPSALPCRFEGGVSKGTSFLCFLVGEKDTS